MNKISNYIVLFAVCCILLIIMSGCGYMDPGKGSGDEPECSDNIPCETGFACVDEFCEVDDSNNQNNNQSNNSNNYQNNLNYLPAFPGAEGFGAKTRGAYALYEQTNNPDDLPIIYHVTSLSGGNSQGMLGHVLRMEGPRIVVFDVGGTISLSGAIPLNDPYVTIAGQTAPGQGILIKDGGAIAIRAKEVIMRGLRIAPGDDMSSGRSGSNRDALEIWPVPGTSLNNVVIDHNTFRWGMDEIVSTGPNVQNISIQYNIIAEALHNSHHAEGPHGKGLLVGGYGDTDYISIHHNIFAFNEDRNPLFGGFSNNGELKEKYHNEVINNYLYHIGVGSRFFADVHYIGNYHDTINAHTSHTVNQHSSSEFMPQVKIYVQDNYGPTRTDASQLEWDIVRKINSGYTATQSTEYVFEPSGITTQPSSQIKELLLGDSGAGAIIPSRGPNDVRMFNEIKSGTGKTKNCVAPGDQNYPTGNVISATSNTILVSLPFTYSESSQGDGYQDKKIKITSGKGSGQIKDVISSFVSDENNDGVKNESRITISSNWNTIPDSTSKYEVITDCSDNAGGWKLLSSSSRPSGFDTDGDGMPNSWESQNGLNPDVFDAHGHNLHEGYANIEMYLNSFYG